MYFIFPDGESVGTVEMNLLDAADVDLLSFKEKLKLKFLLHSSAGCKVFEDR